MIKLILMGIAIGIANIIPGVSGGTVAVIFGVYDKLTESVANILFVPMKKKIEYLKFLVQIGIGVAIGIILFANIVEYTFFNYPKTTGFVFSLLIIPSVPYIVKGENKKDVKNIIAFLLGSLLTLGFIIANICYNSETSNEIVPVISTAYIIKLFLCGSISAGAMIIPGISGSLLLLMLGEYANILYYISTFFKEVVKIENYSSFEILITKLNIYPLVAFSLGLIIGVILVSKIINILLKKYRSITLFFITGIVIISILQIWVNILM